MQTVLIFAGNWNTGLRVITLCQSEGWDPERIIEVPGCVDGDELDVIAGFVFKLVRPQV